MSIKVNIKKLAAWHNDLPDQIRVEKINEVAEDFAEIIQKEIGDLVCKKHPEQDSYITITADRTHFIVIEKQFCCPEFEKKVSPKLQR